MKALDDMGYEELAEVLEDLDEGIETDQAKVGSLQRKLRSSYKKRDQILDLLAQVGSKRGWKTS